MRVLLLVAIVLTAVPAPASAAAPAPADVRIPAADEPVPAGAVVADAERGDDAAPGTLVAPVRTVGRAVALSAAGGTVVLRGGAYRESATVTKRLTIRGALGEQSWVRGSDVVSGSPGDPRTSTRSSMAR